MKRALSTAHRWVVAIWDVLAWPLRSTRSVLVRALGHTRVVESGSPPLYRLLVVGVVISGIAQAFAQEAPESITAQTPPWFDYAFIGFTLMSGILILVGLYLVDENRYHARKLADSLSIERLGLAFLMTVIAVNVVAVVFYYGRPPTSMASWWQIMFWLWGWGHLGEIRKTLGELTR